MANEITVTESLGVKTGYLDDSPAVVTRKYNLSATPPLMAGGIHTIGFAAHEALPMGDVTTAGWGHFENLDTTNFIEIGKDVGGTFHGVLKLKAGERFPCRLGINAPYAKSDTGAVKLRWRIYND